MWRSHCRLKVWKWKDLGSLFFLTDDQRLDHCRNGGNRGCRSRVFLEGRPFYVAAAGMFDRLGADHDFSPTRVSPGNCDGIWERSRKSTPRARRKSRTAAPSLASCTVPPAPKPPP